MTVLDLSMTLLVAGMAALTWAWVSRVSRRLAARTGVALALWLAATAALAGAGVFSDWTGRPPRLPLVPVVALLIVAVLRRTPAFRALVAATPRTWLVGVQTFRVGVELLLFGLFAAGRAPVQVTFEGRNLDVLVGLSAPLVTWSMRRGAPAGVVVGWNLLGLAILGNTVFTVVTSIPGPLHLPWPGEPLTVLATWPWVWLPAFLAPLAVAAHLVSLGQGLTQLRTAAQLS